MEVPSIPSSSTKTIYIYYGNPIASDASNGDDTFEFFDDFSSDTIGGQLGDFLDPTTSPPLGKGDKYASNPIIESESPYDWYAHPYVIQDGDEYKMIFTMYHTDTHTAIGLATSTDGISWTKYGNNPVLSPSSSGWDNQRTSYASLVKVSGTYFLYYTGNDAAIGLATSTDMVNWTKYASNPILSGAGGWENTLHVPLVYKEGNIWYMFFSGWDSSNNGKIGLATSTDGISWTKYASNPVLHQGGSGTWESRRITPQYLLKYESTYYLYYAGWNDSRYSIGIATSADLYNWTKYSKNPILETSASGWDSRLVDHCSILPVGDKYYIWYSGENIGGTAQHIGLAYLKEVIESTKWQTIQGSWDISSGYLNQTNTGVTGKIRTKTYQITNGIVGANLKINSGKNTGLLARSDSSASAFYKAYLRGSSSNLQIRRDTDTVLDEESFTISNDTIYEVIFGLNSSSLNFTLSDKELTANDATYSQGYIGFITYTTGLSVQDVKVRKYTSPEPSTTFHTEEATSLPPAPTIITATALSSTSIRWNFSDNADNEIGFKVHDESHNIVATGGTSNLSYVDETGLSENTQYTRHIHAYNDYGDSSASDFASRYTLVDTPSNIHLDLQENNLRVAVDSFPNDTQDSSGYYFTNGTGNSGWIQTNIWTDPTVNLSNVCNYSDTWTVKYRNGNSVETQTISLTQAIQGNACSGLSPKEEPKPPPPEDQDNDGMPDTWEEENNLDPNNPNDSNQDQDKDGLTNKEEYEYSTDPNSKDTDNDGYTDKVEINNNTDPTNPANNPHNSCLKYSELFDTNPACKRMKEVEDKSEIYISTTLNKIIKEFFNLP